MTPEARVQVNVRLSKELYGRCREVAGPRGFNGLVVEALEAFLPVGEPGVVRGSDLVPPRKPPVAPEDGEFIEYD